MEQIQALSTTALDPMMAPLIIFAAIVGAAIAATFLSDLI